MNLKIKIIGSILLPLFLLIAITGCLNTDINDLSANDQSEYQLDSKYATIVTEAGVNALTQQPSGKTWRDIDRIYRREKGKFEDPGDLQMFRSRMLSHLVKDFHITEEKSEAVLPVLAFWAEEMEAMPMVHPHFAYLVLNRLDGFLTDEAAREYAENYYLKASAWKEANMNPANLESGGKLLNGLFKEDLLVFYREFDAGLKNLATLIQSEN